MSGLREQRGAALAVTLFALVLLEGLIAAVFLAATVEHRLAERARSARQALGAAEEQLARVLAGGTADPHAQRLGEGLYLLDATATNSGWGGRRRLGLLAGLRAPRLGLSAALTTQGAVVFEGGARVQNAPGGGADSCGGSDSSQRVALVADPLADLDYDDLASSASLRLAPGSVAPQPAVAWADRCDNLVASNWGDAVTSGQPCSAYRPVIHVLGDLEVTGGQGQGILLVDGDLSIAGPFQFSGLIIVKGTIGTPAGGVAGAKLVGQVVAANPGSKTQTLAGDLAVHLSKCSVRNALASVARLEPLRSRAWIQLF